MPLLPSSGQLNSMCSLKSSNLRVVFTFAPLDSLSSSPSFATQWLASAGSVGSHPVRSLPLKIGSAAVHAFGELRLSTGARTPARPANTLAPRFSTPVRLPPLRSRSQVVEHLSGLGHRRIAFISGPDSLASARERRDAFLRLLSDPCFGAWRETATEEGNHKVDGGLKAMLRLLARAPRPTAVMASNDLTAIGAMRAIRQRGLRVPEDISVVGFDDIQMAEFTEPPLTTVRLLRTEIARLACDALVQSI